MYFGAVRKVPDCLPDNLRTNHYEEKDCECQTAILYSDIYLRCKRRPVCLTITA